MTKYRVIIRYENREYIHGSLAPNELLELIDRIRHKPLPITITLSEPTGLQKTSVYNQPRRP
jgi:hypothetical protein